MHSSRLNQDDSLAARIAALLGKSREQVVLRTLAGDVSSRRFWRILTGTGRASGLVAMLYPEGAGKDAERYLELSRTLERADIPRPAVVGADPGDGIVLIEDLGNRCLQKALAGSSRGERDRLSREALDLLLLWQERLGPDTRSPNPPFDRELFLKELDLFLETVVGRGARGREKRFREFFLLVTEEALAQAKAFCHRDFHARNLMLRRGKLFLIDFQDARNGPYTYDLVSLLHDPYSGSAGAAGRLRSRYHRRRGAGRGGISRDRFERDCDIMLLQRLLKAAGTYGSVFRRGNPSYLGYIAPARAAAKAALKRQVGLARFLPLLEGWELPGKNRAQSRRLTP